MNKQLTALLTAAALSLSAAPLTASAEDGPPASALPDWIPRDYIAAVDFYNAHGTTYTADGYVCFIEYNLRGGVKTPLQMVATDEPVIQFTPQVVLSDRDELVLHSTEPLYDITVSVFQPDPGELTISMVEESSTVPKTVYTFETDEQGNVTETDVYGWVPDCVGEYSAFDKENPVFSVHNGYIVYCDDVCVDGGYGLFVSQLGTASVEKVDEYDCSTLYGFDMPLGESMRPFILYRAVSPGTVQMTANEARYWEMDVPIQCDNACFAVSDDLSISEISGIEEPYGDCNGDGTLDVLDLIAMQKYLHGKGTLAKPELADLDHDGCVDVFDLALLERSILLQPVWEDGEISFTGESTKLHITAPERYTDYQTKWIGSLEYLKLACSEWNDSTKQREYAPLQTITEDTFKDHTVLLVTSPAGSGSREFCATGLERRGSRLIVHVETVQPMYPTPDEAVLYTLLVIEKGTTEGIHEVVVENTDLRTESFDIPDEQPVILDGSAA